MRQLSLLTLITLISFSNFAADFSKKANMAYLKQVGSKRWVVVREYDKKSQSFKERDISDKTQDAYHPEMSPLGDTVAYSIGTINPGKEVKVQVVVQDLRTGDLELWTDKANQYIHSEFSGNGR